MSNGDKWVLAGAAVGAGVVIYLLWKDHHKNDPNARPREVSVAKGGLSVGEAIAAAGGAAVAQVGKQAGGWFSDRISAAFS